MQDGSQERINIGCIHLCGFEISWDRHNGAYETISICDTGPAITAIFRDGITLIHFIGMYSL